MNSKMTRRDALKLGTSTAISIAATPLLSSSIARGATNPDYTMPDSSNEICYMRAVDMVDAIRVWTALRDWGVHT